jgi:hypothetical protein
MAKITVEAEGAVGAPPDFTYRFIADDNHHRHFLPDAITNFKTLKGGIGRGTVHSFTLTAGKRVRDYVMRVDEPEPGVITETDENSSLVTRFHVTQDGAASRVRITTQWDGAGGVGGFFERKFAPKVLQEIYAEKLMKLDRYATNIIAAQQWSK